MFDGKGTPSYWMRPIGYYGHVEKIWVWTKYKGVEDQVLEDSPLPDLSESPKIPGNRQMESHSVYFQ